MNLLEQAGVVGTTDDGRLKPLEPDLSADAAVEHAVTVSEEHQELVRSHIEMMGGYAETSGCRRQFLLGYFGEQLDQPCGNCDTCETGSAAEASDTVEDARFPHNSRVQHREWGPGVVMSTETDRITVLFEQVGYRRSPVPPSTRTVVY